MISVSPSPLQAWAQASGHGRSQGDSAVWKRNFRSALRAKGFKLVSDSKNDNANPHKVFQWPDEGAVAAAAAATVAEGGEDPSWCT